MWLWICSWNRGHHLFSSTFVWWLLYHHVVCSCLSFTTNQSKSYCHPKFQEMSSFSSMYGWCLAKGLQVVKSPWCPGFVCRWSSRFAWSHPVHLHGWMIIPYWPSALHFWQVPSCSIPRDPCDLLYFLNFVNQLMHLFLFFLYLYYLVMIQNWAK